MAMLLLTGCPREQPVIVEKPVTQMGRRVDPPAVSKSFTETKDVFQGAEYDPTMGSLPANARQVRMRVGQVMEVYRASYSLPGTQPEMAFYLPVEARSVVQLVVESRGVYRNYFLRAIGPGQTVGGVVERRWLGEDGFNHTDLAAMARIQDAIRANPYMITVE